MSAGAGSSAGHALFRHPTFSLTDSSHTLRRASPPSAGGRGARGTLSQAARFFFLSSLFPRLLPGPFPPSAKGRGALGTLPQVGRSLPPIALSSPTAVRSPLRLPERVGCLLSSDLLLRLLPGPFPPPAKGHEALSTLPQMGRFLPPMVLSPPPAVRAFSPPAGGLGAQGTLSRALCLLPPADPFPRPPSKPLSRPSKGRGAGNALSRALRLLSCGTLPPPAARALHPPIEGGGTQGTPSRAPRFRLLLPASFPICRRVLSPRPPNGAERDQSPKAVFHTGQGPFPASPPLF